MPRVLNLRTASDLERATAIIVDRTTAFGNPYKIEKDQSRAEVLTRFRAYLKEHPKLKLFARQVLRGRDLLCWCAPEPCHADVWVEIANQYPLRVISGGQTGVDQESLTVALEQGFPTGGTMPKGWRTSNGADPLVGKDFGLVESWSPSYRVRTMTNVRDGDLTVWFGTPLSAGGRLTISTCQRLDRRYMVNPSGAELRAALEKYEVKVLNCAGNRKSTFPEASVLARKVLEEALA